MIELVDGQCTWYRVDVMGARDRADAEEKKQKKRYSRISQSQRPVFHQGKEILW